MTKQNVGLTFRATEMSVGGMQSGPAIEIMECVEWPQIGILRERKRFIRKARYFVNLEGHEHEFPTLKDAFVWLMQATGRVDEISKH